MGNCSCGWFRRKKSDFESRLKELDAQIADKSTAVKLAKNSQRNYGRVIVVLGFLTFVAYGLFWWVFMFGTKHENLVDLATTVLPFPGIVLITYLFVQILKRLYSWRISRWEMQLEELKSKQLKQLEEVKDAMNFKKNFNLLLEYSQKLDEISAGTNATKTSLWQGIDLELLIKQQAYLIDMKRKLEAPIAHGPSTNSPADTLTKRRPHFPDTPKSVPQPMPHHPTQRSTSVTTPAASTPVTHTRQPVDSPMIQPAKPLGPVVSPTLVEAAAQHTSLFDRLLDNLMGGDDVTVHCGNCKVVYACIGKDQALNDFICRTCRAVNKVKKGPAMSKTDAPINTAASSTTTTSSSSSSQVDTVTPTQGPAASSSESEKEKKE